MLENSKVGATIGVRDIARARNFYESSLGLHVQHEEGDKAVTYRAGNGTELFVYESQLAGGNQATGATWQVDNLEREVGDLASRGVKFEHYDMPDMERQGDIHRCGDVRLAWFKDPDGNIHGLASTH